MRFPIDQPYPEHITLATLRVPVKLAFWRILLALRINNDGGMTADDKISIISRIFAPWSCLLPFFVRALVVKKVFSLLFDTEKQTPEDVRCMDLEQDAGLIKAAFLQAYHIDLERSSMHWMKFQELLNAIPENTTFAKIVELRRRPLPKPTKYNQDEIAALQKAKAAVALDIPEEERRRAFMGSLKRSSTMRG